MDKLQQRPQSEERARHEVEHGRLLAAHDPDVLWGWGTPAGRVRAERRARQLVEHGQMQPGIRALEIGCGSGLFTEKVARSGADILAVDISPELLALARKRDLEPGRVRFLLARFEDRLEVEGPFDVIYGSSVLHHLELRPALLRIYDFLRPGGLMVFAEPNMLNPQVFLERHVRFIGERLYNSPDETAFVRWRLKRTLEEIGFGDVQIRPFDWLHPWTPQPLIGSVYRLSLFLEKVPLVREFSGSLLIRARRGQEQQNQTF
jgi:2-polyprenyl-3-methyl-5-hydroxy-6-metoxy-1,4-benzoquinol methylase